MSDRVEERIVRLISTPEESPYGNPIPGLAELELSRDEDREAGQGVPSDGFEGEPRPGAGRHLLTLTGQQQRQVRVVRIGEPAQVDPDVVALLVETGVLPGRTVTLSLDGDRVLATGESGQGVSLPKEVAEHLFAEPL